MQADQLIDKIIEREGGYVDNSADRGGCTNWGITLATLSDWRDKSTDCEDVKNLTKEEAKEIYQSEYMEKPGFSQLEEPLRSLMVDSGVQHGPEQAAIWLQKSVGAKEDGVIGPKTLEAIADSKIYEVYYKVLAYRIQYYGAIISNDEELDGDEQAIFAEGWMNRIAEFVIPVHAYILKEQENKDKNSTSSIMRNMLANNEPGWSED